jgi:hypothetical protein
MAPGAPFSLFSYLMEKARNNKGCVAVAFPPALNPDFLYAALDATAYGNSGKRVMRGETSTERRSSSPA